MTDKELKKVAGGLPETIVYSFKKNDRINTEKSSDYLIVEETVETTDPRYQVKVTEHTRGESAVVYTGSYVHRKAEYLAKLYSLYGGKLG